MMTREQRIDYEILECALNGSRGSGRYATTAPAFLKRLRELFPDIVAWEFTDACKRLFKQNVLHLRKFDNDLGGLRDYQGARDDVTYFGADSKGFYIQASGVQGQKYFKQLSALIEGPAGFKRWTGID